MSATSAQEVYVRRGKVLYHARILRSALESFKEASLRCSCNKALLTSSKQLGLSTKQIPIPVCYCKDFTSLSTESHNGDKLAMYRLATKPCTCGSGVIPCQSPIHLTALDGMAAVCERMKDFAKALQYASLLVVVAPHAPEGYLRMAKALRLKAQSAKLDEKSRCLWIYTQASVSVRTFGDKHHEKLKILETLIRKDIVRYLPPEVQQIILGNLSYTQLCTCMRVSRAWNYACRNRGLWADLKFVKCWRDIDAHPFRPGVLNDIISKRSQNLATSLTITSMTDFNLDDRQLNTILRALPQLNRLSIQVCSERDIVYSIRYSSLANPDRLLAAINEGASSTLEVLQLRNLHKPEDLTNSGSLFSRVSEYLKELSLVDLTGSPMFTKILGTTEWPKLEKLTITGAQIPVRSYPDIDISAIAHSTPALKDLTLSFVEETGPPTDAMTAWDKLERLSISDFFRQGSEAALVGRTPALRSVDFRDIHRLDPRSFFGTSGGALAPTDLSNDRLEHVEHLCYLLDLDWMDRSAFKDHLDFRRIQPSCANGTLRSLEIIFDLRVTDRLDKVLNKQAIHTLGCHEIDAPSANDDLNLTGNSDAFLDWLDTFPNLHTVGVFPDKGGEKAWIVIAKLLRRRHKIKTIYTDVLYGVYRDELLARARSDGIEIFDWYRLPEHVLAPTPPPPGPVLQLEAAVQGDHLPSNSDQDTPSGT